MNAIINLLRGRSVVDREPHKLAVAGSIPAPATSVCDTATVVLSRRVGATGCAALEVVPVGTAVSVSGCSPANRVDLDQVDAESFLPVPWYLPWLGFGWLLCQMGTVISLWRCL